MQQFLKKKMKGLTKKCIYNILCMSGKVDKGQISYLLKVRFNWQKKTITKGKIEKSSLAEHV